MNKKITRSFDSDVMGPDKKFQGLAIPFNEWTTIYEKNGSFEERVDPKCKITYMRDDLKLFFEHTSKHGTLASTKSGTLRVNRTSSGLYFDADVMNTQLAKDVYESVKREVVTGVSFGGYVTDEKWDGDKRTITGLELNEISIVTRAAYEGTLAIARSKKEETPKEKTTKGNKKMDQSVNDIIKSQSIILKYGTEEEKAEAKRVLAALQSSQSKEEQKEVARSLVPQYVKSVITKDEGFAERNGITTDVLNHSVFEEIEQHSMESFELLNYTTNTSIPGHLHIMSAELDKTKSIVVGMNDDTVDVTGEFKDYQFTLDGNGNLRAKLRVTGSVFAYGDAFIKKLVLQKMGDLVAYHKARILFGRESKKKESSLYQEEYKVKTAEDAWGAVMMAWRDLPDKARQNCVFVMSPANVDATLGRTNELRQGLSFLGRPLIVSEHVQDPIVLDPTMLHINTVNIWNGGQALYVVKEDIEHDVYEIAVNLSFEARMIDPNDSIRIAKVEIPKEEK
ncbi:HK97 family phage prohead protease [Bacillus cereus group sp. BY142LC]|uniref:HK97 family phage prohead protease n=1 Tax=Bacillus cereus group sp. BY142LC TaxID=3018083 RepID=UPI0022E89B97|nr:HK97 family phage prohead protease [Bacillus cereus group sp. BY142LC]MDA1835044.1 HK97 family phage prohead protease [Bacillus cereus group sp. BY142LC]